jgi:hypothetical protein
MTSEEHAKYMYLIENVGFLKEKADELTRQVEDDIGPLFFFKMGQLHKSLEELDDYCAEILEEMQEKESKK